MSMATMANLHDLALNNVHTEAIGEESCVL